MATATATTTTTAPPLIHHPRPHAPHHRPAPQRCPTCPPEPTSLDWAVQVLSQPTPPTVREILTAYTKNGREDRELLLSLLAAKAAEDNRIANQTALHRSLLHLQYDLPLSPPPEPDSLPSHAGPSYLSHPSHPSHSSHPGYAYGAQETYKSSYPSDRPYGQVGPQGQDQTYPSPTTSSPPGMGSRSPPSSSSHALGKRGRSPGPASYSYAREKEPERRRSPPSRSSPMSLRGILQPQPVQDEPDRAAKRSRLDEDQPHATAEYSRGRDEERTGQVSYARESNVRVSPGHRVSHERTRSRDGE